MKNFSFILILILSMSSCTKDNDNEALLVGEWQLVEVLMDPGDGSGTFQPMESNVKISFYSDNIVKSNASFCQMGVATGLPSTATYSTEEAKIFVNCDGFEFLYFEFEGDYLIMGNYMCIEQCSQKYRKIQ